ncbi:MAG: DUF421 domain-containing protein [Bacilli bacterium]|nr:DUF421 domain-containing protein [Bacilli bacterium]
MKFLIVSFRTVFFYFVIVIVYRLMGKREIGELSIIDLIISLFIAELVAISIENYNESVFLSLLPILLLAFLQILSSKFSFIDKKTRDLLDGKPSVIIKRGKVNFKEMKRIRYNIDDLLCQLRGSSIKSIKEVDYAILEANGKLSIFKKEKEDIYPLAVILDGEIDEDVLFEIGKNKRWIIHELHHKNLNLEDIFYAFFHHNQLFIIEKDKIK